MEFMKKTNRQIKNKMALKYWNSGDIKSVKAECNVYHNKKLFPFDVVVENRLEPFVSVEPTMKTEIVLYETKGRFGGVIIKNPFQADLNFEGLAGKELFDNLFDPEDKEFQHLVEKMKEIAAFTPDEVENCFHRAENARQEFIRSFYPHLTEELD